METSGPPGWSTPRPRAGWFYWRAGRRNAKLWRSLRRITWHKAKGKRRHDDRAIEATIYDGRSSGRPDDNRTCLVRQGRPGPAYGSDGNSAVRGGELRVLDGQGTRLRRRQARHVRDAATLPGLRGR